jgi:U32 family peptidase
MQPSLEILAPAGDEACLDAALRAGADAIYFGLDAGFNARVRATNLPEARLSELMSKIHDYGRRGYLTLNTLVFDDELGRVERLIRGAADAGVDAIIVQDLAVVRLVKRLVPTLRLHASTQITCTDRSAIELLTELGVDRITLARELSLSEIAGLAANSPVELEIFAHGALCIAFSGQCLTSEAIGGRSANRGACAQACRLPYDFVVDGALRDLADAAYLLSPKDLDTSSIVPKLLASGVRALKIEGRMKGPDYVAATTKLYRMAVDAALGQQSAALDPIRELSAQAFSRGASAGFLLGTDHQSLVDGTYSDHVGIEVGTCLGVVNDFGRHWLRLRTHHRLARGDGVLVQGGRAGSGEFGGRIWQLRLHGREIESADAADELWLWLGPQQPVVGQHRDRRVFRTSSNTAKADLAAIVPSEPERMAITARLSGRIGHAPRLSFETADGRSAEAMLDHPLALAHTRALDDAAIREKLERLGDTRYRLERLDVALPNDSIVPLSALNRARREITGKLERAAHRPHLVRADGSLEQALVWPDQAPPPAGLFVTCRTREQAEAALSAGAHGIYLDLVGLSGVAPWMRDLRAKHAAALGVALPRVRKPGEDGLDAFVRRVEPDMLLVRSLGSLQLVVEQWRKNGVASAPHRPTWIGDFSLNVTNRVAALELLARALSGFTPGYDLDAAQLLAMLGSPIAPYAEVVLHHPMPLFHTQHCLFAALLSDGHDTRDCGRPCEQHVVALRDRKGMDLPVLADVACRNTVFHASAQSAADVCERFVELGVRRFRVELVRETPEQADAIVAGHLELIAGRLSAIDLRRRLSALGLAMVRGSLRVVG